MTAGDNPFAPGRLERVLAFDPALAGTSWEALEEKWRTLGCRAAVTGYRGSGKSALLRAWAGRCDSPVWLHFNEQHRRLSEADRLSLTDGVGRSIVRPARRRACSSLATGRDRGRNSSVSPPLRGSPPP